VLNMEERQCIWIPVLDECTIDGNPIDKEFIRRYGPSLQGKPVNLDHNYDQNNNVISSIAIGEVLKILFDEEDRLYAIISIFGDVWSLIKDEVKGCSFEWNPNLSRTDGIMGGLALCRLSNNKVPFASFSEIYNVLASKMKQSDNMIDVSKLTDEEKKELANALLPQVKELLASEMKPGEGEGEGKPTETKPDGESAPQENALAEVMKSIDTSLKTLIKSSEATQQQVGILASTMKPKASGNPPAGGGNNDPPAHRSANLGL